MFRRYLVTGATGFLGRAVISELMKKDADIVALVLEGDRLEAALPARVRRVAGDVSKAASLEAFAAYGDEKTCVIHCAGIVSVASNPGLRLYLVNVEGTNNILNLCLSRKVAKLVYVSSVHAIPERPKGSLLFEPLRISPELVSGDYAKSKAIATRLVMEAAEKGLNASIVFPSGLIGPGDIGEGSITHMLRAYLRGRLPFAVKGGYNFVDVRDVAEGIVACGEYGKAGAGYILSGHSITIPNLLSIVQQEAKRNRPVLCLPAGVARLIAPCYEKYSLRRKKPLFFTPLAIAVLCSNAQFSHSKATRALGYRPRPIRATLRDTVVWLSVPNGGTG